MTTVSPISNFRSCCWYGVTLASSNRQSLRRLSICVPLHLPPCPLRLIVPRNHLPLRTQRLSQSFAERRPSHYTRIMLNHTWPELILEDWQDTLATVHMWTP